jgi:hypothetical protein
MAGNKAWTYDDSANKEDLLEIIQNLSPTETQLVSGLGVSAAKNVLHEYLVDTLSAVKTNAQIEGADATFQNLTNPSRLFNYTQIFKLW